MSYNIDSIEIIKSDGLFIATSMVDAFNAKYPDRPESWEPPYGAVPIDAPGVLRFRTIPWYGEFSGNGLDALVDLLGQTYGSADLLLCWEGGDDYSGLRVVDGVVTKHKIVMSLGDQE